MAVIRDATEEDREWLLEESVPVGGPKVVAEGFVHDLGEHPALIAEESGEKTGFVVYKPSSVRWVILAIRSLEERRGLGSQLLDALEARARNAGAEKLRISTIP